MADAILTDIAIDIVKKLGSLGLRETRLWWGVKEELEKLRVAVSMIQAVLLDAEEQYSLSHQVKVWVDSLKEAFYDADDLLDEFSTDVLLKQMITGNKMLREVSLFFSSSNPFVYGLKMAHKIENVRSRLDEIAANRRFHLNECQEITAPMVEEREQTHSSLPQVVVGRKEDKKKIVDFLLSSSYGENVSIISIVGIGGLGKTTLAQLAYNDVMVKSYFELKMWVCISDNFGVKIVVEKILECLIGEKPKNLEMNTLKDLLREKIHGKKYLLVLDDLWNEDFKKWFDLKDLLVGGASGSKIMVTTRLENVAKMIRSNETCKLQGLLDHESWYLFAEIAFNQGRVTSPKHEIIGKEIVAKCSGVPLAIRAIGSLLYYKNTTNEWESFKEKELLNLNEEEIGVMKTLRLSYNHLPSHLKCCFAYCRLFPKGAKISIRYMMSLWLAQGFIRSSDSEQSFEDIGLKYFKNLLWRSFFQEVEEDIFGNLLSCKMHDLIHDLAVQVAGEENVLVNSDAQRVKKETRHVSLNFEVESWQKVASSLPNATKVRTFIPLKWSIRDDIKKVECQEIFSKLSHARVLNLQCLGERVPHSIDKLKHIRFLDLSENKRIEVLPNSIIKLQNLQFLYLVNCERLKQLPKHIKMLVNLQQLYLEGCESLTHMPCGIGQLNSLENLSVFMVAKDNGVSKHSGGLSELRDLNNLRGWLHIKNLRYVKDPASEFEAANLKEKQHLQTLILAWRFGDPDDNNSDSGPNDVEISLEKLRPHVNLKWLIVFGCGRLMFPNWISFLTNLVELKIVNCKNCQHFPPLDQFPSLKRLGLHNLNDLEYIESGIKCHNALFFPSLENLWLENCPNLQGWRKPQLLQFHCIVYLQITSCPNLTSMPLIPSIQHLVLINACKKLLEDKLKMKISVSQSTSSCSSISTSQLKVLQIEGIEDLEFLSEDLLQNLTSLQSLYIRNCPRLRNLSSRHLSSLVFLVIKACEELDLSDDMQWHYLRSLRKLQFRNMNKLVSLPKGLQHVPTLLTLLIKRCPNLISLPEWMRSLTELQYLFIKKCPQLSERYESNMCADWAEIGYIPNISIDKRWIQEDGCYKL